MIRLKKPLRGASSCGHFIRASLVWRTFQHQRYIYICIRNELPGWRSRQGFVGTAHGQMNRLSSWYHIKLHPQLSHLHPSIISIYHVVLEECFPRDRLYNSVLTCVNPQAFLLWKVKNRFHANNITYHKISNTYDIPFFQNGSLQSSWNRRAYLGLSREAKAESVIRLLSSFKHGQEGAGEGPIILKDLSGQCWERSHATQRKPDLRSN